MPPATQGADPTKNAYQALYHVVFKHFFLGFFAFSTNQGSLTSTNFAFFWCAMRGVQYGLCCLHIALIVSQDGFELLRCDAIACDIVFYLAQEGIAKAMYGLSYESITVPMIQHSVLLSQGLFAQGAHMALILHCLLPVGPDLTGFEFGHALSHLAANSGYFSTRYSQAFSVNANTKLS